jgi:hypothetical protein
MNTFKGAIKYPFTNPYAKSSNNNIIVTEIIGKNSKNIYEVKDININNMDDLDDQNLKDYFKYLWSEYKKTFNSNPEPIINFLLMCKSLTNNTNPNRGDNLLKNITCNIVEDKEWQPFYDKVMLTQTDDRFKRIYPIIVSGRSKCKYKSPIASGIATYGKLWGGKRRTNKRHAKKRRTIRRKHSRKIRRKF